MAYVPQLIEFDDPEATVLETIRYALETNEERARSVLAAFHFRGKDILKKVGALSGGEKSRLKVCILMQGDANFLLLDEPTNHLDIPSREWIEEAVSQFGGTILFISHDRFFINKFGDRVWELENGRITDYHGTYEEYCGWKSANSVASAPEGAGRSAEAGRNAGTGNSARGGKSAGTRGKGADAGRSMETGNSVGGCKGADAGGKKAEAAAYGKRTQTGEGPENLDQGRQNGRNREQKAETYRQKKILDYESRIEEAEARLRAITSEMEQFASDYGRLNDLYIEKSEVEKDIEQLYGELCSL
jgi:ABC-type multidrug transport system ATPase subunit